jgi:hypothetical protein
MESPISTLLPNRIINYSHNIGAELGLTGQDIKDQLIEEDSDEGEDVDDTVKALGKLGRARRSQHDLSSVRC